MPKTVERTWEGDLGAMGGRRARASFLYQAFVPDEIAALSPVVPFEVADLSADAEAAIRALNDRASVGGLEAIGPLLLRSEAVASSRIEGYDVSSLNLARALIDPRAAQGSARIVAANVSAMEEAIAIGDRDRAGDRRRPAGDPRGADGRRRARATRPRARGAELDRRPAAGTRPTRPSCRRPRTSSCRCSRTSSRSWPATTYRRCPGGRSPMPSSRPSIRSSTATAASAGRSSTSCCGAAASPPGFVPPVSIVLAARPAAYVEGLVAFREGSLAAWIGLVRDRRGPRGHRCRSSSRTRWRRCRQRGASARAARGRDPRRASSSPCCPPCRCSRRRPPVRAIGVSQQQTLAALKALAEAGVIRQLSAGTYDRQYAATELFDLLTAYEEGVVGPARSARQAP